jgi:hypothetical protein
VFAEQTMRRHAEIPSSCKSFVLFDAASGADGHRQVNNRLRLVQEASGWMDDILSQPSQS